MTDKAIYFHYCGKIDLKLLILRLIISYLETFRMRRIEPI